MPQVIDHARRKEELTLIVDRNSPGVAGAFSENIELFGVRIDPPQGTSERPAGVVFFVVRVVFAVLHVRVVKDSIETIQPAVWPPGQRVRQFVGIVSAPAGEEDFGLVGFQIAIGVLQEEQIRRVTDPDPAVSDVDPRRDVEPLGKDRDLIDLAVLIGVFQDLDPVAARPGLAARVFKAFRHPEPTLLVDAHGDGIHDLWLAGDDLD